ncbi:MAG TPA: hypothetical protein VFV62_11265 [Gaiellaceae bacterium]|nr:hypothetical protein [Gaiellaceae bacterium]
MEGAPTHIRRQLGMIMVEEGFLTPEQLEGAIAEQHRTSKPLGQVLVELGLASAGAVANALAEQHGGLLKTEFGLSAGLRPQESEPTPALEPIFAPEAPLPQLRVVGDAEGDSARRRLVRELEALREQCETLSRGVLLLTSELERLQDSL